MEADLPRVGRLLSWRSRGGSQNSWGSRERVRGNRGSVLRSLWGGQGLKPSQNLLKLLALLVDLIGKVLRGGQVLNKVEAQLGTDLLANP